MGWRHWLRRRSVAAADRGATPSDVDEQRENQASLTSQLDEFQRVMSTVADGQGKLLEAIARVLEQAPPAQLRDDRGRFLTMEQSRAAREAAHRNARAGGLARARNAARDEHGRFVAVRRIEVSSNGHGVG